MCKKCTINCICLVGWCLSCTVDVIISKSFITNATLIYFIFKLRSARPKRNSSRGKFYWTTKTQLGYRQQTAKGVGYLASSKTADYFTWGSCFLLNYYLKQMNRGYCKTQCLDYLILVFPCNSTGPKEDNMALGQAAVKFFLPWASLTTVVRCFNDLVCTWLAWSFAHQASENEMLLG